MTYYWDNLKYLLPLILIQVILMIVGLVALKKSKKVNYLNKPIWALIIIFINILGPILFLIIGVDKDGE